MVTPGQPPVVALLTDMGWDDWYVGAMKGVVLKVCPSANVVDLCHSIAKQSVDEAIFVLRVNYSYFPDGTIFLCVVDPQVGSDRLPLIVRTERFFFIAPNNGLLSIVRSLSTEWEVRAIENPGLRLPDPSETFHGRDIFGPAAGHLAAGHPFEDFGPVVKEMVETPITDQPTEKDGNIQGRVIYIDSYGNLLTSITREMVGDYTNPAAFNLHLQSRIIHGLTPHFAAVPLNHPLMYWGSSGLLEIALNQGSAARKWGVKVGEFVRLERT